MAALVVAILVVLVVLALVAGAAGAAQEPGESCSNAQYRTGFSATLADCRAYEMVTPVNKNGANVDALNSTLTTSSLSGDRVQFTVRTGLPDSHGTGMGGYTTYVASRGSVGWSYTDLMVTPAVNETVQYGVGEQVAEFSDDLSRDVIMGHELPGMTGAYPEWNNFYLENSETGELLEPIVVSNNPGKEGDQPQDRQYPEWVTYTGGSSDLGVTTFETFVNLVPEAGGERRKLYALEHGTLKLVGVLPDGSVASGGSEAVYEANNLSAVGAIFYKDAVSQDGSRIFFYSPSGGGGLGSEAKDRQLYLRRGGSTTVMVSESETGTATPEEVSFQAATPDGKKVLFTTSSRLTDSDPGGPGSALYLYTDGQDPKSEQNLTFIARLTGFLSAYQFERGSLEIAGTAVKGLSPDGSHVYFASTGHEGLPSKTQGMALYLWDNGEIRQVAPEAGLKLSSDAFDSNPISYGDIPKEIGKRAAAISASGDSIAFVNDGKLTHDTAASKVLVSELYRYDEQSDSLTCISCPRGGSAAVQGLETEVKATLSEGLDYEDMFERPRFYSSDGRFMFFNTKEALLPQDTNGLTDAYEYDTQSNRLSLVSSGVGEYGTWFVAASDDGRNAFLVTRQQLSPLDVDKLVDIYDARIDGGFPLPPVAKPPCVGDECQGVPLAPPAFNVASTFNGAGNIGFAATKTERRSLTRAQRLKRALESCRGKRGSRVRRRCRTLVRKRYALTVKVSQAGRSVKGR
jgi:hypothetical protein